MMNNKKPPDKRRLKIDSSAGYFFLAISFVSLFFITVLMIFKSVYMSDQSPINIINLVYGITL